MRYVSLISIALLFGCDSATEQQQYFLDACRDFRVSGDVDLLLQQGSPNQLTLMGEARALATADFEQTPRLMSLQAKQPLQAQLRCVTLPGLELLGQTQARVAGQNPVQLSKVGVYGQSAFVAENVSAADLSLRTSGQGRLAVQALIAESLHIQSSAQSQVHVAGESGEVTLDLNGGAVVDAAELRGQWISVNGRGLSQATVWASAHLGGVLTDQSNVAYRGTPDINVDVAETATLHSN